MPISTYFSIHSPDTSPYPHGQEGPPQMHATTGERDGKGDVDHGSFSESRTI